MQATRETPTFPSDPLLTIDTGRLGDLWLPSLREHQESLEYMDKACHRAGGKKTFKPLHTARMAVLFEVERMVQVIHERGGLLLIGGAA